MEYFSRKFNWFLATRTVFEYSISFRLSRLERRVSSQEKQDATANHIWTCTVGVGTGVEVGVWEWEVGMEMDGRWSSGEK